MKYINITLIKEQTGMFSKAIVEFQDEIGFDKKIYYNQASIKRVLEDFAMQENISVNDLLNSDKVTFIYDNTNEFEREDNYNSRINFDIPRRSNRYKMKNNSRLANYNFKKFLIKIGFGVIILTTSGITIGNAIIKRHNVYNNQHAKMIQNGIMPKNIYNVLNEYDEFEKDFQTIVDNDYDKMQNIDLKQFQSDLDTLLQANDNIYKEYYNTGNVPKEKPFNIDFCSYFPEGSYDYEMLKSFENYCKILNFNIMNGNYTQFKESYENFARGYADLLYKPKQSTGVSVYYTVGILGNYIDLWRMSPLGRYCILRAGYSSLETVDVQGDKYKSNEDARNLAKNGMKGFVSTIMSYAATITGRNR